MGDVSSKTAAAGFIYKIGCLDRIAQNEAPRAEVSEWPATATATAVATATATAGNRASGRGTAWITRGTRPAQCRYCVIITATADDDCERPDHSSDLASIVIDL